MPERKNHVEEKMKCAFTFKIPISFEIPLSVSGNLDEHKFFKEFSKSNNTDQSKQLREILYNKLGLKTVKDVADFFEESINIGRNKIYSRLKTSKTNSFSSIMLKGILESIKKGDDSNGRP